MLEQRRNGRPIRKIIVIWTTRDREGEKELMSTEYIESILSEEDKRNELLKVYSHCTKSKNPNDDSQKDQKPLKKSKVRNSNSK